MHYHGDLLFEMHRALHFEILRCNCYNCEQWSVLVRLFLSMVQSSVQETSLKSVQSSAKSLHSDLRLSS